MAYITFYVNNKVLKIQAQQEDLLQLKNDDEYAILYITSLVRDNQLNGLGLFAEEAVNLQIVRESNDQNNNKNDTEGEDIIWQNKGKPTQKDRDALQFMLELRGTEKYSSLFDNKQSVKSHLWAKIGAEMTAAGFNLGTATNIPEKLRQKFTNLTRTYNQYNHYVKTTTGTEPKPPPEYYDEMHPILGDKHKSHPPFIKNSINILKPSTRFVSNNIQDDSENNSQTDIINEADSEIVETPPINSEINSTNRFSRISKSCKPRNTKHILADHLQEMHTETLKQNEQQFSICEKLLKEQNDLIKVHNQKRDKLIDLFSSNCKPSKKRRRSSSD